MVHYYYIVCGALLTHCFLNAGSGYCHLPEFDLLRLSRFTVGFVYAFLQVPSKSFNNSVDMPILSLFQFPSDQYEESNNDDG